jgi:peptidoglycan/xylan/chitin deacetylase (PgdA/CDA1 family)
MNAIKKNLLKVLIQTSKQGLLVPFYHMVSDTENTYAAHLYTPRKITDFKHDLDVLSSYYKPLRLKEFRALSLSGKQLKQNYYHLTFDDGLSNFYKVVAPILLERKVPATVFINTDFVDNKALFYRYKASLLYQVYEKSSLKNKHLFYEFFEQKEGVKHQLFAINYNHKSKLDDLADAVGYDFEAFLREEQPYLTTHQINELIDMGFTIGGHSKNHPLYTDIHLDEQIKQTIESVDWLVENFNLDYRVFSFPFTDLNVSKDFFDTSIYRNKIDFSFGTSGIKKEAIQTNFQRIFFEIENQKADNYLLKEYLKFFLKIPFNKNIMPRSL